MTTPRSQQIDLAITPYYHCVARCVRKAFLSGYDQELNKDFSHRKQWILQRIKYLANVFFIDICAYAVMSNHYHLVMHVDLSSANKANLEDLLYRWHLIFPADATKLKRLVGITASDNEEFKSMLAQKPQHRLSDISWYMRCMNEMIAKMANKEDDCTGRFWEGRFKSQALLDDGAFLSVMVYVDLNPIRAGISQTPEESDFTSIQERLKHYTLFKPKKSNPLNNQPPDLMPFLLKKSNQGEIKNSIEFYLEDYFELVDTTGRIIRDNKRGYIPNSLKPILDRLKLSTHGWLKMINGVENNFYYAIGNFRLLNRFNPRLYLRRPDSIKFIKQCYNANIA